MKLRCVFFLVFVLVACTHRGVSFKETAACISLRQYIPSGDGWPEARRRRLVTRYLEQAGFEVRAVVRPFTDGRADTKYRQVDLVAQRVNLTKKARSVKATLALLRSEKLSAGEAFAERQKACDSILLQVLAGAADYSRLELVTAPVCFGLTAQGEAQE